MRLLPGGANKRATSDARYRHDHFPTAGEQNFSENGSETTENDQSGLPPWAAALTAQVTAQLRASFTVQLSANQEALRAALEECSASARDARLASAQLQDQSAQLQDQSAQLQDQRQEIEALSPLTAHRYYALQAPLVNR